MIIFARMLALAVLAGAALPAVALEIDPHVPPEINFGGTMLVTAESVLERPPAGDGQGDHGLNISDSSLLFMFSKHLYADAAYGFAVIGVKLPDDGTDLRDDLYVHQAHAGIGGKRYEAVLGRTRLPNTLISFPTVRDEDLLEFTHVPNGLSNADASEYQLFGGAARGTWWFTPFWMARASLTARTVTDPADLAGNPRSSSGDVNGGSATLAYDAPEAIRFGRGIRFAAVSIDHQRLDARGSSPKDRLSAYLGGITLNVSDDPERTLVVDVQGIVNQGADAASLGSQFERARAKNRAVVAAVRYGHRPWLQTRWLAGVTAGWKRYSDRRDAVSFAAAPNWVYRLGSGVDLMAQYVYRRNRGALAEATGISVEQEVLVGLRFSFDATINETVGESRSILNLEHDMLDIGPSGGGH